MAGIYIHIPFCSQACSYCDFHFSTSLKNKSNIISAINMELKNEQKYLEGESISTIYFGGGTPSLIDNILIESILRTIQNNFNVSDHLECTIEANPEDISSNKINDWFTLGFNRISLGVQSFRAQDLNYMNRIHTQEQSLRSIELLNKSKINNFNIDLIYGFPSLSDDAWTSNLQQVIQLDVPHISCYCLTIEPNTALFHHINNKQEMPLEPKRGRDHFLIARDILTNNNYSHYEISNFSKNGYKSAHNNNYWNKTKYLGVGPSAHSFNGRSRRWSIKNNTIYYTKILKNEIIYEEEILTPKDIINEYILTSIRTSAGLDLSRIKQQVSESDFNIFNLEVHKLHQSGFIELKNEMIYLNEKGMLFSDRISQNLFLI